MKKEGDFINKQCKFPGSLHNHTDYSNLRLRDCINKVSDLIDYAIELGHKGIAITDHESISGHVKVEKYAKKIAKDHPDFKVIRGNEIYLVRNGLNNENYDSQIDKYFHFILLAKDAIGHKQIREISTRAWRRSYMARGMRRVPTYYQDIIDIIGANPGHVIGSTACLGGFLATKALQYAKTHDDTDYDYLVAWCTRMEEIFGKGNFFLELQPSPNKEQKVVNRVLVQLSFEYDFPYIITTDSHYLKKEDAFIHKAFLNSQDGDREVDSFYASTYLMGDVEIRDYLNELTEDEINFGFSNIEKIMDSCENYTLSKPLKIPQLPWRDFNNDIVDRATWIKRIPYMETFWNSSYIGDRELANAIVLKLLSNEKLMDFRIYDAINECLEMTWISSEVNKTHWSAYYLNLQKIIDECWNAGTLVGPGRGSGVGFILLYLLDITQINPLWETTQTFSWRFLNPERVSVLDVDVDIEGRKRAQVLAHLREVYGSNRVANVATFGTEKSKSAILTAARGLGIDVDIASYLASMIKAERGILQTLDQTFYGDEDNGINPNKQFVAEMTDNYPELWSVAHKIEGLISRTGIHAGGVIFVDEDFEESTALMRAPDGTLITQFDLHDAEECSLIKYDLLSVEALDKIHICLDLLAEQNFIKPAPSLKETYEQVIGIYNLERDSAEMWRMVHEHKINALFQMEKQSGI
jgi:DNA polymerase-3 subunit alpha